MLKQNGVQTGEKRLFTWLRDNGYLIRRKGKGQQYFINKFIGDVA